VRTAVRHEQAQPAQDQEKRANTQPDALPRAVAQILNFVIHGELLVHFRGRNAANQRQVALFENFFFCGTFLPQQMMFRQQALDIGFVTAPFRV